MVASVLAVGGLTLGFAITPSSAYSIAIPANNTLLGLPFSLQGAALANCLIETSNALLAITSNY